ncbi:hypothetical protein [Treponema sp.]|uniref:hypothetical protein n=1 Tax=Treponema sp. TaxID=166 RepID=UPI00388EB3CA
MKKLFFSILICQLLIFSVFAQNTQTDEASSSKIEKSLFITAGPKLMLNTDDSSRSAPSPVMYSLGLGCDFLHKEKISFQTHASFFTNYYLWDGKKAQPAEVENRTGTALSLMIDLTCGRTFSVSESKNHMFSVMGGLGFLARYALLSNGVNEDDLNRETSTTAKNDISDINSDFYKNLNFIYPEILLSYTYNFSQNWKIGTDFRTYIPISSIINDSSFDSMIFSFALKFFYK